MSIGWDAAYAAYVAAADLVVDGGLIGKNSLGRRR
jgi:hypothetical protein